MATGNIFSVGDMVVLRASFLGEPIGTRCYVYDEYSIGREPGVSLITENGEDLGGFNAQEQKDYLGAWAKTGLAYHFRSVSYLAQDFRNGHFKAIFADNRIERVPERPGFTIHIDEETCNLVSEFMQNHYRK